MTTEEHTNEEKHAQVYELGYHVLPTVSKDELDGEVAKIRAAIEKRGGSFIAEGTPETITLAYTMYVNNGGKQTGYNSAHFGWIKFEMATDEAVALQKEDLDTNANILRYIVIRTTKEETRAQVQLEQNNILREVKNESILEKKEVIEEGGEVSDEEIDKSIEDLVEGEEK